MKLESLLEKFTLNLEPHQRVISSNIWCLPLHTIGVSYKPVLRRKMDILMKMLLISVQKARFTSANQISEILIVEELFVQDLLSKMEKIGLIQRNEQVYQITEKGNSQLKSGVYEEDLEATTANLLYSPLHEAFLTGDLDEVLEYEDFPEEIYRYYKQLEQPTISNELILKEIQTNNFDEQEIDNKTESIYITSYDEMEFQQINDIPCIELIIHDEKNDTIYPRIWNTLLTNWDEVIEKDIHQNESSTWKEKIL